MSISDLYFYSETEDSFPKETVYKSNYKVVGFETQIIQNTVGCFLDNFRRKQASCYFPLLTNSSHRMRKFS